MSDSYSSFVGRLHADGGSTFLDPGLRRTAICATDISEIDSSEGRILYRGQYLDRLVRTSSYVQVLQLLCGVPTNSLEDQELDRLFGTYRTTGLKSIDALTSTLIRGPILTAMATALATVDDSGRGSKAFEENTEVSRIARLMSLGVNALEMIAEKRFRHRSENYRIDGASLVERVWAALTGISREPTGPQASQLRLVEKLLIIHAEHGMNCSTTAVRVAGSAGNTAAASLACGILTFSGPRHGGAAARISSMLREILQSGLSVESWLDSYIGSDRSEKIDGIGHRVYSIEDPRVKLVQGALEEYRKFDTFYDPLHNVALRLARAVEGNDYFANRGVLPNVDLFSSSCFRALGIPSELRPAFIAVARMAGWYAHWLEASARDAPLIRPRDCGVL